MADKIPKFSDLPLNKDDPHLSAWGLYGKDDQLGFLNRLTDDVVLEAAKEIKTGKRVSLNWEVDALDIPFFTRKPFEHTIKPSYGRTVNDDLWHMNTQSSSQWDGLRHFGYQKEKRFYNGVTQDDIHGPNKSLVNGIHEWSKQGIVGRGILLDFHSWRLKQGIPYDAFKPIDITLEQLKAVAEAQGTEIRFGDILLVRSGFIVDVKTRSEKEMKQFAKVAEYGGVQSCDEVLQWIWENFSAVAGDQPAFERLPMAGKVCAMHEVLLSGWGCPIGELFDLEALAEQCEKLGRWSFFVTSEPVNVPGGVASPPNILAIF